VSGDFSFYLLQDRKLKHTKVSHCNCFSTPVSRPIYEKRMEHNSIFRRPVAAARSTFMWRFQQVLAGGRGARVYGSVVVNRLSYRVDTLGDDDGRSKFSNCRRRWHQTNYRRARIQLAVAATYSRYQSAVWWSVKIPVRRIRDSVNDMTAFMRLHRWRRVPAFCCQGGCRSQRIYTEGDRTISTVPGQKSMEQLRHWQAIGLPCSTAVQVQDTRSTRTQGLAICRHFSK